MIFHRVLKLKDPLLPWPDAAEFEEILQFVDSHFTVLLLSEAIDLLERGRLPAAAACITFDDGYADNADVALPLLQRYRQRATVFVATAYLDGGRMWNDDVLEAIRIAPLGQLDLRDLGLGTYEIADESLRLQCFGTILHALKYFPHVRRTEVAREIARRFGVPDTSMLMMTGHQLKALHDAGLEVGGHTHTHPILEMLPDGDAEREIAEGKEILEAMLGEKIGLFAYPNGIPARDFSARHAGMAKRAGFSAAFSTSVGIARRGEDLYQLPRMLPFGRTQLRMSLRWATDLMK